MKLGVIIYSADPEAAANGMRLANLALQKGDQVRIFLLGKAVENEYFVRDSRTFRLNELIDEVIGNGGEILASETCLSLHGIGTGKVCLASTLDDLYRLVCGADKVVTF